MGHPTIWPAGGLFGAVVFAAVLIAAWAAFAVRLPQLASQSHSPVDAFIILGLIFLVLLTLFFFEVFAYVATAGADWTPFGALVGSAWSGVPIQTATALMRVFWWANILVVLSFLIYIPNSKHLHLLATPFHVFFPPDM